MTPEEELNERARFQRIQLFETFNIPPSTPLASWGYEPNEEHEPQHSCSSPNSRKSDCVSPELRFSTRKSDEIVLGILMFVLILLLILLPSLLNPVYQTINEKTPPTMFP